MAANASGNCSDYSRANCSRVARYTYARSTYAKSSPTKGAYIPYRFVDGVTESAGIPIAECDDFDSAGEEGGGGGLRARLACGVCEL